MVDLCLLILWYQFPGERMRMTGFDGTHWFVEVYLVIELISQFVSDN